MYPYVPVLIRLDPNGPSGGVRTHLEGFGDVPIPTEKTENPIVKTGKWKWARQGKFGIRMCPYPPVSIRILPV